MLLLIGGFLGMGSIGWFFYKYSNEDRAFTNQELAIMSRRMIEEEKTIHRATKTVLTLEDVRKIDPTFVPPQIPRFGEPDI